MSITAADRMISEFCSLHKLPDLFIQSESITGLYNLCNLKRKHTIYFLCNNNVIIYIGRSSHLVSRVYSHRHTINFDSLLYVICDNIKLSKCLEYYCIISIQPELNTNLKTTKYSIYKHL